MPLQLGQVIRGIGSVQLAGVDQTHEEIAHSGAIQRLIEECGAGATCGGVEERVPQLIEPAACTQRVTSNS